MKHQKLIDYLASNDVVHCVIIDIHGNCLDAFGSKDDLQYAGLYESLFGDGNRRRNLFSSIRVQAIPQSWKQGVEKCLVFTLDPTTIAGVFYLDKHNIMESYQFGIKICFEIQSIWIEYHNFDHSDR